MVQISPAAHCGCLVQPGHSLQSLFTLPWLVVLAVVDKVVDLIDLPVSVVVDLVVDVDVWVVVVTFVAVVAVAVVAEIVVVIAEIVVDV